MENCCIPFRFIRKHANRLKNRNDDDESRCSVPSSNCPPTLSMCARNGDDDSRASRCVLIDDVLVHIFRYLPLSDRKNVKQMCRLWNEACAAAPVTKSDKLVFRPNCSIPEIADLLRSMSFKRIHIEFQNHSVDNLPADVWEMGGHKVSGLHFYRCRLNQQSLKVALEYCENLRDINLCESGSPLDCEMLDQLIGNKIKREKVSSFAITYAHDEFIDVELLRRIFVVFPSIQNFTTGNAAATCIPNFSGEAVPPQSVAGLKNLVYLHHNYSDGTHWSQAPMIPLLNLKLKKFETTLNPTTPCILSLKETLFEFFNRQDELEIVNLRIIPSSSPTKEWTLFIKQLTFLILERCTELREFRLTDSYSVHLTTDEAASFFMHVAKMKCLVINENCFRVPHPPSAAPLANRALDILRADTGGCDAGALKTCMLRRCSLKHLRVGKLTDEIFQKILETQTNLRTLILDDIQDVANLSGRNHRSARSGHRRSVRQLRRLEYLGINERYHYKFTEEAANEFCFPALKYLRLNLHSYSMPEKLSRIASRIPAVEVLELSTVVLSRWTELIVLCHRLRNLRRLSIYNVEKPRPNDLVKLFQKCHNLRYVSRVITNEVFSLNPFAGRLSSCGRTDLKFPEVEDIFDG